VVVLLVVQLPVVLQQAVQQLALAQPVQVLLLPVAWALLVHLVLQQPLAWPQRLLTMTTHLCLFPFQHHVNS
jgi:hypothetical protein